MKQAPRLVTSTPKQSDPDFMPCGHTKAQAAWLGCTEDGQCRPRDEQLSAETIAARQQS